MTRIDGIAFDGCGRIVIAGEADSAAERFAGSHGFIFIPQDIAG